MSYEDEENDESYPVSFSDLKEIVLKEDDFCWGCEVGLNVYNPEEKIKLIYDIFRKGRTNLNQKKLFYQIYRQKIKLYPDDTRPFNEKQIKQHFHYHIKDYFTELVKQSEDLATDIATIRNIIYRAVPTDGPDGNFKLISGYYKNLLDAKKYQLILLDKIEKYRENERNNVVRIGS